jgi:hypothetical protein
MADVLDGVEQLLDREHAMIMAGRYAGLVRLSDVKGRLADDLANAPLRDAERLDVIRQKAVRNDSLLDAVCRGLKSAIAQISDARSGGSQQTYARNGKLQSLSSPGRAFERKI